MMPEDIIQKYYKPGTPVYDILLNHSLIIVQKSLEIAQKVAHLNPDTEFIKNAAMLHDIGIFMTKASSLGCSGKLPYVCHGYLGRQILDEEGLDKRYGLVAERHTGAGITKENIIKNNLPVPQRDMVPLSLEEKIICVADKFHSKSPGKANQIFTPRQVIKNLERIEKAHAQRFAAWAKEFGLIF